jgi:hypothetical protein
LLSRGNRRSLLCVVTTCHNPRKLDADTPPRRSRGDGGAVSNASGPASCAIHP